MTSQNDGNRNPEIAESVACARAWLDCLDRTADAGQADVDVARFMLAAPGTQARFIGHALGLARTDWHLANIAAGPLENLLGHHGAGRTGSLERTMAGSAAFRRALTGVWRHHMPDKLWQMVRALQDQVADPLPRCRYWREGALTRDVVDIAECIDHRAHGRRRDAERRLEAVLDGALSEKRRSVPRDTYH